MPYNAGPDLARKLFTFVFKISYLDLSIKTENSIQFDPEKKDGGSWLEQSPIVCYEVILSLSGTFNEKK